MIGGRHRAHKTALAWTLLLSCSSESVVVLEPPPTTLPSAIYSHRDGGELRVHAVDLSTDPSFTLSGLQADTLIEVALLERPLSALGLTPGPIAPAANDSVLRVRDAEAFFQVVVSDPDATWAPRSEPSAAFGEFPLPSPPTSGRCDFELEELSLEGTYDSFFMSPDDGGRMLLGGDRLFRLELVAGQTLVTEITVTPTVTLSGALTKDESGYWLDEHGQVWTGEIVANELALSPIGAPSESAGHHFVGRHDRADSLFNWLITSPQQSVLQAFDGQRWQDLHTPEGGAGALVYAKDELVFVEDQARSSYHFKNGAVDRYLTPTGLGALAHSPELGLVAGGRAGLFVLEGETWKPIANFGNGFARPNGLAAYQGGLVVLFDARALFWWEDYGFCPSRFLPGSNFDDSQSLGEALVTVPRARGEGGPLSVFVLRPR